LWEHGLGWNGVGERGNFSYRYSRNSVFGIDTIISKKEKALMFKKKVGFVFEIPAASVTK
jgi:hypothetical protein